MNFPRLYAIADADLLAARSLSVDSFVCELLSAGVRLVQYRDKQGRAGQVLENAGRLRSFFSDSSVKLMLNDRADLARLAHCHGVHVGQDDLAAAAARSIVGPESWVGVSTHTTGQVMEADRTSCDYIAFGPIFPTSSKNNPDPVVGVDGLRAARTLTRKPLVAIGGITRENCRAVIDAGADSVAIISALLPESGNPIATVRQSAGEFLSLLQRE
ncbi:MAG TPA: thiamine phosphate synthase [Acidobacteriaceae bacterium]|nr:thiamine phosphate synthase [Acidobacteriaceae bacterium]